MSETKHFVRFFFPGVFMPEETVQEVSDCDPKNVTAPERCFAFEFFERTYGEVAGEVLKGDVRNKSGRYYVAGMRYALADLEREFPTERVLISNMKNNGWPELVRCNTGNWQPLRPGDVLLDEFSR